MEENRAASDAHLHVSGNSMNYNPCTHYKRDVGVFSPSWCLLDSSVFLKILLKLLFTHCACDFDSHNILCVASDSQPVFVFQVTLTLLKENPNSLQLVCWVSMPWIAHLNILKWLKKTRRKNKTKNTQIPQDSVYKNLKSKLDTIVKLSE